MRVVSDTSVISSLAIINRLDLLRARYGEIRIPPEVSEELQALSHIPGKSRVLDALRIGWVIVESPAGTPKLLSPPLDKGEEAAISLSLSPRADLLLIDERRGRQAARLLGLRVAGVLGELIHAKETAVIPELRRELELLKKEARFFINRDLEAFILATVGES